MALSTNLGFPRIGSKRELKKATETYWAGRLAPEALADTAARLRAEHWRIQQAAGIDHIPSNDFSLYDHVLDTAALLGAVPERYGWSGEEVDLDTYFAMARGAQRAGLDVGAMEMTKWFDTNYHYIVPELMPDQTFRLASTKPFDEFSEALALGVRTRPVLLGPVSFLLLSKPRGASFDPLAAHLDRVTAVYAEALRTLSELGAEWIQLDEPAFVLDRTADEIASLDGAYGSLASEAGGTRLLVQTYFGHVGEAYETLVGLPVAAIGLDFVRGRENLDLVRRHGFPLDKTLGAGVVDGRNVWINDLDASFELLGELREITGPDRLFVAPSCSLLHVPIEAARETGLDDELKSWLAFAFEKLGEVRLLARAMSEGRDVIEAELAANRTVIEGRRTSTRVRNAAVRRRLASVEPARAARAAPFTERRDIQQGRLGLPALPTTLIGSFPQHSAVRARRREYAQGKITREEYEQYLETEIRAAVELQEEIGIDVIVHGEFERNDMVEYFGERMEGYAFTAHGWVQSYGSRYVKPPLLFGDVRRREPITVRWWETGQACTERPVKGMLTGPVTMLQWSFVRDDQPRSDTCLQLALAIGDEVLDLEAAGAKVIQVDEPALREGLPLRREAWEEYLDWSVAAFRMATSGVRPETQIQTHMCYSEFNDIIEHIARMDADVLLIENARSDQELLGVFREFAYDHDIGPGVYDIHSPRVPSVGEMAERIRASLTVLPIERLWVNPDCGLKTRRYEEVLPALRNMVAAAGAVRHDVEARV
ncbi:MAG TPA: 5-methyltetrahydropteroyltriglutamate--homocysteine S-methyltransferase [Gemmatimonadota bacterium]|nr:5-methyltetrahydropteroyltriglutamate--homocysteine S-methyltransferase [Gemmatimonadota bacterium]